MPSTYNDTVPFIIATAFIAVLVIAMASICCKKAEAGGDCRFDWRYIREEMAAMVRQMEEQRRAEERKRDPELRKRVIREKIVKRTCSPDTIVGNSNRSSSSSSSSNRSTGTRSADYCSSSEHSNLDADAVDLHKYTDANTMALASLNTSARSEYCCSSSSKAFNDVECLPDALNCDRVLTQIDTNANTHFHANEHEEDVIDDPVDEDENDYENENACSICLEPFLPGEEVAWSKGLECRHCFHSECLIPWLMKRDDCPLCRTEFLTQKDFDVVHSRSGGDNQDRNRDRDRDETENGHTDQEKYNDENGDENDIESPCRTKQGYEAGDSFEIRNGLVHVVTKNDLNGNCYGRKNDAISSFPIYIPNENGNGNAINR